MGATIKSKPNHMIDFSTFCYSGDKERLYMEFSDIYNSHQYVFDNIIVVHQMTASKMSDGGIITPEIWDDEIDQLLERNGINPNNPEAEYYTHGPTAAHYWKWHCINHLKALEVSEAEYIVLSDSDCRMIKNNNWIKQGIEILKRDRSILVVSPSDGGTEVKTQIMSQQLFLCERERLKNIKWEYPFEGFPPNGPFQEYWWLAEGRIGKYMEKNGLYRYILGHDCRYWHFNGNYPPGWEKQ